MDFNDSATEARFREDARAWLKKNAPTAAELEGLDYIGKAKLWQKRKFDAGWACLRWPKEFGGRGASAIEQVIWGQEESKFETPQSVFQIGQGMAAPDADGVRERRPEETLPAEACERRRDLVSALQRTGRRFGPRGIAHAFGETRRRMGDQRPENLDVRRALQRLGHSGDPIRSDRAEAQRADVLLPEHEKPRR